VVAAADFFGQLGDFLVRMATFMAKLYGIAAAPFWAFVVLIGLFIVCYWSPWRKDRG